MVLPSRKKTRVKQIVAASGNLDEAVAGRSVTLTLTDELDITRGDMLVRPGNLTKVSNQAEAILVWMSEQALVTGKRFWIKHTTNSTAAEVTELHYKINVNTLHRSAASNLQLNEIGRCRVQTVEPLMYDDYRRNRQTGAFILVDRLTHETVAAGMFIERGSQEKQADIWDHQPEGYQLQRSVSHVTSEQRRTYFGHDPLTILITGLSGAGKTSTALALEKLLFDSGYGSLFLGFSAEERSENLRRAAEIARLINDSGQICIAAFVAPHQSVRERVRQLVGTQRLFHVHLSTRLAICRERDRTKRYEAAQRGEIADFPGVTSEYELPQQADMFVSAEQLSAGEIAEQIFQRLDKWGIRRSESAGVKS
jgi:bifunctional enzyme CysN/CysC